jgi:hypothetical protein
MKSALAEGDLSGWLRACLRSVKQHSHHNKEVKQGRRPGLPMAVAAVGPKGMAGFSAAVQLPPAVPLSSVSTPKASHIMQKEANKGTVSISSKARLPALALWLAAGLAPLQILYVSLISLVFVTGLDRLRRG